MDSSILSYGVSRFLDESGKTRFIVTNRVTGSPSICLSLFEHEQSIKGDSSNSTFKRLTQLAYFYTWADMEDIPLDTYLLNGNGVTEAQIRKFTHWLRERKGRRGELLKPQSFNSILDQCSRFCIWCGKWEANRPSGRNAGQINHLADQAIKLTWSNKKVRARPQKSAPDIEENEISLIQMYFQPKAAVLRGVSPEQAHRDYLIWRLSIEMGLRISEILALRLKDCPARDKNYISIVRIEDRGIGYSDPRKGYAPRPKTLTRDLGFVIEGSPLPRLIQEYISKYRYKKLQAGGKQFLMEHDFLILALNTGAPLSVSTAEYIAEKVSNNSAVHSFHWHLSRHAFFNRAYSAVAANQSHLNDLVYYGGWSDANSLNIYIQRAIRNRAIQTISIWQQGNKWETLAQ